MLTFINGLIPDEANKRWIERQTDVTPAEKTVYYILDKTILGEHVSPPGVLELARQIIFELDSTRLGLNG